MELLRAAGVAFQAVPPRYEEPDPIEFRYNPAEFAQAASYFKARSVADDYPDRLILAADTIVALNGQIYGKPVDARDARRILAVLAGTTQEVITGVTLYEPAAGRRLIRHGVTRVTMRPISESELDAYIASGQWQGKAGGYGIQDSDDPFVQTTEGSLSNVVGLPVELVMEMLAEFDAES